MLYHTSPVTPLTTRHTATRSRQHALFRSYNKAFNRHPSLRLPHAHQAPALAIFFSALRRSLDLFSHFAPPQSTSAPAFHRQSTAPRHAQRQASLLSHSCPTYPLAITPTLSILFSSAVKFISQKTCAVTKAILI